MLKQWLVRIVIGAIMLFLVACGGEGPQQEQRLPVTDTNVQLQSGMFYSFRESKDAPGEILVAYFRKIGEVNGGLFFPSIMCRPGTEGLVIIDCYDQQIMMLSGSDYDAAVLGTREDSFLPVTAFVGYVEQISVVSADLIDGGEGDEIVLTQGIIAIQPPSYPGTIRVWDGELYVPLGCEIVNGEIVCNNITIASVAQEGQSFTVTIK